MCRRRLRTAALGRHAELKEEERPRSFAALEKYRNSTAQNGQLSQKPPEATPPAATPVASAAPEVPAPASIEASGTKPIQISAKKDKTSDPAYKKASKTEVVAQAQKSPGSPAQTAV